MMSPIGTGRRVRPPEYFSSRQGFTFLELIMVLLIVGTMVSLSVPSLSVSARQFSFRQSVSRIQALLRYIQRHAVIEQRTFRVVIDAGGARKRVEWLADPQGQRWEEWTTSLLPTTLGISTLQWRNEQSIVLIFYPNGALSSADLPLHDNRGNHARIQTSLSGEIVLHPSI